MKIAIPEDMGKVNPHFGQSIHFTLIDMANTEILSINRISVKGLQHNYEKVAQILQDNQVDVVLVGNINKAGFNTLKDYGFLVISGVKGDIMSVASAYARGDLTSYEYNCSRHKKCCPA